MTDVLPEVIVSFDISCKITSVVSKAWTWLNLAMNDRRDEILRTRLWLSRGFAVSWQPA